MARAKAVTLTQSATNPQPGYDPTPMVVVGNIPVPASAVVTLPAVPASFADEAAVRTFLLAQDTALRSSPYFN